MSGKLIAILMSLGALCSVAVALTWSHQTTADFDQTFGEFVTASTVDSESTAADCERLLRAGLERLKLERPQATP